MVKYVVGLDPGINNMGFFIMNEENKEGDFFQINLLKYLPPGESKMTKDLAPEVVLSFIRDYHDMYFKHSSELLVEKLPNAGATKITVNPIVAQITISLYVGLAAAYPKAEVHWSIPKTMRAFFDITVSTKNNKKMTEDEKYEKRKDLSEKMLPEIVRHKCDLVRLRQEFTIQQTKKRTSYLRDHVDAALHAIHYVCNKDKFPKRTYVSALENFRGVKKVKMFLGDEE